MRFEMRQGGIRIRGKTLKRKCDWFNRRMRVGVRVREANVQPINTARKFAR